MSVDRSNEVNVLKLTLHGSEVGYLVGFDNGKNVLIFSESFKKNVERPTLGLITHPSFPRADKLMAKPWVRHQRLHPTLSNLLPEGSLRELITQGLKVHVDNEFLILSYLGKDLPGALVAFPMDPEDVPDSVLIGIVGKVKAVKLEKIPKENKFSLAGIQMKFSMREKDGRYNLAKGDMLGDWIIKTPSTKHKDVPLNEYTAMTLASLAGIIIPEIKLVEIGKLDNLPTIRLPDEKFAFAIKRFDRDDNSRIHMEDFAQVLVKYPHEKYNAVSYEQIGRILYEYSGDGLADVQQFARRLLVNILLANSDAHLKNWSLIYSDQITPRFSPAYDIVTTKVYIDDEQHFALNLGKNKDWYKASYAHFEAWAERSTIPWRVIKPHLDDAIEKARSLWPAALKNLPMNEAHKKQLQHHWKKLHSDFQIK
ncbi:MAG: type II toxin-antitoxin system HipA family toxin [Candidatus Berkiella sp.]